jgi:14-3-3 protein epsilon
MMRLTSSADDIISDRKKGEAESEDDEESVSVSEEMSKQIESPEDSVMAAFGNTRNLKAEAFDKAYYLASVCIRFDKYEDAVRYIDEMVKLKEGELTEEERHVVITGYKFFIAEKRTAWRNMFQIEVKEQNTKLMMNEIRAIYEEAIIKSCERFINLVNNYIINTVKSDQNIALFLRVKADHFRYMAEITNAQTLFNNKQSAFHFYKQAYEISNKLDSLDVIKLSIALNYSVFLYEILSKRLNAIFYAKEALARALIQLKGFTAEEISDEKFRESLNIVEIMNQNVHAWYKEELESVTAKNNEENEQNKY